MMSLGQYTTVLLMLTELKQYDKAALFLQTCLKHNLLEKNSKTGKLSVLKFIILKPIKFLSFC